MISFGLHNRIIAHPGRAFGLAKALDWLTNRPQGVARAACRHSGALAQMAPTTARGLTRRIAAPGTLQTATETHSRAVVQDSAAYCLGGSSAILICCARVGRCLARNETELSKLRGPSSGSASHRRSMLMEMSFDRCLDELRARNASESVRLTCRSVHHSRLANCAASLMEPVTSSSTRTASLPPFAHQPSPSEDQARGEPMAGNIADRHARLQRLIDDRQLLLRREPPPAGNAGDDFHLRKRLGNA